MKLSLCTLTLLAGVLAPVAQAFSLYDTAPAIGLAQNASLTYTGSIAVGFDDNINGTATNEEGSMFTRFGIGASQSENDAMTRLSWTGRVGGTIYNKEADGTGNKSFADVSLALTLDHTINEVSSNNLTFRLSITPELDYSNGISSANREGDSLNWSLSDAYTRKLDGKKSLSLRVGYSGNIYLSDYYDVDDRQYLSASTVYRYKASTVTSYSLTLGGKYDFRSYGYDSQDIFFRGGVKRKLSEVSSMGISLGAQVKFIDSQCDIYPNLRASYRRTVAKGLTFNAYVALENENIDTYRYELGGNYRSDMTWRIGGNLTQQLTSRLSLLGGFSIIDADYTDSDIGAADRHEVTYNVNASLRYQISSQSSLSLSYLYTIANEDAGDYDRNMLSASISYLF
ncbi:MAG: hypothetical protein R3Y56_00085 [Akkermansia sp.]